MRTVLVNYRDYNVIPYVHKLDDDQFIITINNYINNMPPSINDAVQGKLYFQSDDKTVAVIDAPSVTAVLDVKEWDKTEINKKYLAIFLAESFESIKSKVESGEYKLTDLN